MFRKSSLELNNIYFFFFFVFFLSLFIGMIDLFFSSSLSCSNVICTENNKNDYLLSMPMCFSLEDNDCFFLFIYKTIQMSTIYKNLVCLINLLFVFVHFFHFLFKIYLYNSLYYLLYGHFSHR
jgi:hypothetical protein